MLSGFCGRRSVRWCQRRRPTLLLRCLLLIVLELAANAVLWIVAAIVFRQQTRFLSLCLLAWTLGLRHALDADHISVIDNATRRIVSCPRNRRSNKKVADETNAVETSSGNRRPVTCGLWFSLGHSTIVVGVICAVAISLGVIDRLGGVSSIGGVVGASVSGATLFLFAIVNSVLLVQSIKSTNAAKQTQSQSSDNEAQGKGEPADHRFRGIFTRIAYPLFKLVDSPYKLYPIGVLFGLGFDTASSIALLGVAGATNTQIQADRDLGNSDGSSLLPAQNQASKSDASIILLALLFTAGMTLVDSFDSVLMINAYAPGELLLPPSEATRGKGWRSRVQFLEHEDPSPLANGLQQLEATEPSEKGAKDVTTGTLQQTVTDKGSGDVEPGAASSGSSTRLSHILTLLSIILAFAISIITIMGLIGEHCDRCARAAVKQDESSDGGLEGRWWLFWQQANDASGIIGAAIVGGFAAILAIFYTTRMAFRIYKRHTGSNKHESQ